MASQSTLLGAAGEHYVMAELLRRGYIAALAPHGVPNADIVVTDLGGSRLCSIQVKTRRDHGSDGGWHMKAKHEQTLGDRLFYCMVDCGKTPESQPVVYVLPSALIAKVLSTAHQKWLATPGKNGRAHKDSVMCVGSCRTTHAHSAWLIILTSKVGLNQIGTLGVFSILRRLPSRKTLKISIAKTRRCGDIFS